VRVVEVPTAVLDRNGKPIRGLTAGDFQLLDNNRAQQIRLDYIDQPISVAIAVQNNDSARTWLPQVARVKSLIESLLVGANGEASVGVFSDEVRAIQPLTERFELLDKALQSIKPTLADKIRTLDAVMAAAKELEHAPPDRRRVILLIAQAGDIGSETMPRDVLSELELNNVVVYGLVMPRAGSALIGRTVSLQDAKSYFHSGDIGIVGGLDLGKLVPEIYRAQKAASRKDALSIATAESGGRELPFRRLRDLEGAVSAIAEEIHTEYVLRYAPNPYEPGYHRIRVHAAPANAAVYARPGYYVPESDERH
jgi:VWFA-related protein